MPAQPPKARSVAAATAINVDLCIVFMGLPLSQTLLSGVCCVVERGLQLAKTRLRSIQKMLLGAARVHVAHDTARPMCFLVNKYVMSIPDP
jgi:hypothetical protein